MRTLSRGKLIPAVGSLLAAVSLVAGCGGDSDAASDASVAQHFRMVVLSVSPVSASSQAVEQGARERAAELGVVLDVVRADAGSTQVQQLRDAIRSGQYIGGFILPLAHGDMCDVSTNLAPANNFMVVVVDTPICGREGNEGDDAWAPGTLAFVSAGPKVHPQTTGATAIQALYDARVGRTPIPRFYATAIA